MSYFETACCKGSKYALKSPVNDENAIHGWGTLALSQAFTISQWLCSIRASASFDIAIITIAPTERKSVLDVFCNIMSSYCKNEKNVPVWLAATERFLVTHTIQYRRSSKMRHPSKYRTEQ